MTLSTLRLRNYRSFARLQTLELRPLTLFYGGNSAGKSALVRLLPLLADSMGRNEGGPLNLDSPAAQHSTFDELRWKGLEADDPPELLLTLEWPSDPALKSVTFELDWESTWQRLIIKRFEFQQGGGRQALAGRWHPREGEQQAAALTYDLEPAEPAASLPVQFRGLVPEPPADRAGPTWSLVRSRLLELQRAVLWLGSRHVSGRIFARPTAPRWTMQPDGSDVGALLASQEGVREDVSAWCRHHLRRSVEVVDVSVSHFRVTLRHVEKPALDVDLLDAGEGALKVLPVLAALSLVRRRTPGAPSILAIEEPESHLHPSLQRALSENIATTVGETPDPTCVVLETHSQHILLGVQIQVARGVLDPRRVQVYWVHQDEGGRSVAEPVQLAESGRLVGNWPGDVYTEVNDMAAELILAQQERRRS